MAYGLSSTGLMPRAVKILLIANIGLFVLDYATQGRYVHQWLALRPDSTLHGLELWRLFSYMFVHDTSPPFIHILFNMLMLWMFGVPLTHALGERKFWLFYLAAGFFSALCSLVFFAVFPAHSSSIIGASGAIFGLMFAFAKFFPTQQFLMFFIFPVQARYAVLIIGAVELLLITSNDGIAHITHLGGALFAWLYFRFEDRGANLWYAWKNREAAKRRKSARKSEAAWERTLIDVDPILKKISLTGLDSLTREEKETLQKASELKRKQRDNVLNWSDYRRRR